MRSALLYVLAAVCLALIVSVAWWSREVTLRSVQPTPYAVRGGDTITSIARDQGLSPGVVAELNNMEVEHPLTPGQKIQLPAKETAPPNMWLVHAAGLGAEILGVLMSFWLSLVAGLLPAGFRKQVLGISAVLGLASYAAGHAADTTALDLTPQFVFRAITDGFAWSSAFPLFARAFGITADRAQALPNTDARGGSRGSSSDGSAGGAEDGSTTGPTAGPNPGAATG